MGRRYRVPAGARSTLAGASVVVLTHWAGPGPRDVLVALGDGSRHVLPLRGLRRLDRPCR
ncbi:MAG TPA: hypothetical protein VKP11_06025 [Frankiaceae bacterium]|nr:hypothetical protein [Frankiaceae bacterium]